MISCLIGAAILAAASVAFQMFGDKDNETKPEINPKAVMRDGILGAIFTAMAWTLIPESMESVTESVTQTVAHSVPTSSSFPIQDFDLQIGPARF